MIPTWDEYFMAACHVIATRSKDQYTQLGAVIVGSDHTIRSLGYNGLPRGVDDDVPERQERPEKYYWFEHAERNAIYNACRVGVSLLGCTLYVPWIPCADCVRGIIQCGIKHVVTETNTSPPRWAESYKRAIVMLREAGVELRRPS